MELTPEALSDTWMMESSTWNTFTMIFTAVIMFALFVGISFGLSYLISHFKGKCNTCGRPLDVVKWRDPITQKRICSVCWKNLQRTLLLGTLAIPDRWHDQHHHDERSETNEC